MKEETKLKISLALKGKMPKYIPDCTGRPVSAATRKKISNTLKKRGIMPISRFVAYGIDHPLWKGQQASYSAMHHWIKRELGKPFKCNHCDKKKGRFEWANISHKYKRDVNDYMSLCYSCHDKYDDTRSKMWNTRRGIKL